jgi:hypothetical protein
MRTVHMRTVTGGDTIPEQAAQLRLPLHLRFSQLSVHRLVQRSPFDCLFPYLFRNAFVLVMCGRLPERTDGKLTASIHVLGGRSPRQGGNAGSAQDGTSDATGDLQSARPDGHFHHKLFKKVTNVRFLPPHNRARCRSDRTLIKSCHESSA